MQSGIVLASSPGSSGTRQIARQNFCVASKEGAAAKEADGYGKALRLTIAFRFFGCGANIKIRVGRSCSTFGDYQTCRSLIATSAQVRDRRAARKGTKVITTTPRPRLI